MTFQARRIRRLWHIWLRPFIGPSIKHPRSPPTAHEKDKYSPPARYHHSCPSKAKRLTQRFTELSLSHYSPWPTPRFRCLPIAAAQLAAKPMILGRMTTAVPVLDVPPDYCAFRRIKKCVTDKRTNRTGHQNEASDDFRCSSIIAIRFRLIDISYAPYARSRGCGGRSPWFRRLEAEQTIIVCRSEHHMSRVLWKIGKVVETSWNEIRKLVASAAISSRKGINDFVCHLALPNVNEIMLQDLSMIING